MKTSFFTLALATLAGTMAFVGCKSNTVTPKQMGQTRVVQYCSVDEYPTTKDYFRASATGESPKMEFAKKIARTNARTELGTSIRATLQSLTENYSNQDEVNLTMETMGAFEELARIAVDETLVGSVIVCEEVVTTPSGGYMCYTAVELSGNDAFNKYAEKLSNDERTRLHANVDNMRSLLEAEMTKNR